ncbi:MAG: hypothetical protein ACPG77_06750, partial [Nannocystaceae bacterium]
SRTGSPAEEGSETDNRVAPVISNHSKGKADESERTKEDALPEPEMQHGTSENDDTMLPPEPETKRDGSEDTDTLPEPETTQEGSEKKDTPPEPETTQEGSENTDTLPEPEITQEGSENTDTLLDPETTREALSWAENSRARVSLEMRLMLHALTHEERNFDLNPTAWFKERCCSWVVTQLLGVDQVEAALTEQQNVFDRAFQQHVSEFVSEKIHAYVSPETAILRRIARIASLPKVTVQRVVSRPGEQMHIATLARVAVALGCPLFGFGTPILEPKNGRILMLPERS